jgi:hypothetical protein
MRSNRPPPPPPPATAAAAAGGGKAVGGEGNGVCGKHTRDVVAGVAGR